MFFFSCGVTMTSLVVTGLIRHRQFAQNAGNTTHVLLEDGQVLTIIFLFLLHDWTRGTYSFTGFFSTRNSFFMLSHLFFIPDVLRIHLRVWGGIDSLITVFKFLTSHSNSFTKFFSTKHSRYSFMLNMIARSASTMPFLSFFSKASHSSPAQPCISSSMPSSSGCTSPPSS